MGWMLKTPGGVRRTCGFLLRRAEAPEARSWSCGFAGDAHRGRSRPAEPGQSVVGPGRDVAASGLLSLGPHLRAAVDPDRGCGDRCAYRVHDRAPFPVRARATQPATRSAPRWSLEPRLRSKSAAYR